MRRTAGPASVSPQGALRIETRDDSLEAPPAPIGYDRVVTIAAWVTIENEYVNMADINAPQIGRRPPEAAVTSEPEATPREPAYDLIELLFFAYRDFVGDPDHVLERYRFGRAHHRVLHFVHRNPRIRVADLLDILKITKQSLARVLRDLIDQGFITQSEGQSDRRQRLLTVTDKGRTLALELARLQTERFQRALVTSGTTRDQAMRFLFAMIDPSERELVTRLVAATGAPRIRDR